MTSKNGSFLALSESVEKFRCNYGQLVSKVYQNEALMSATKVES